MRKCTAPSQADCPDPRIFYIATSRLEQLYRKGVKINSKEELQELEELNKLCIPNCPYSEPNIKVGDKVDTGAPKHQWYKYGTIISVDQQTKTAKVKHDNDEIGTYGFRQLKIIMDREQA